MVRSRVIEKFVVRVNPAAFGYRTAIVLIRTSNGITKDDVIQRVKQFGDLAYHVHHMGRTSVAALIIKKPLDDNIIQSLNDCLKPATVISIAVNELSVSTSLSETDLRIIKCLLLGARTEISDIAKEVRISEKTTTRRLNRMKEGRLIDFSIQCNPAAMIGRIQFAIPITVAKSHYRSVLERMYAEFQANILYSPIFVFFDPADRLTFVLFGENVFTVDSVLAKVNSFEGVKSADVYILTKWQYYDNWIMKEVDERLLPRPLSRRSIKVVEGLKM
jgi:DNA-binding Lrp family transcriptional regulator